MQAVILAGGLGTRLRPIVSNLPKPMAPINGRPFLEYLLDYLLKQGVAHVVLAVGYLRDVIINYFGHSWRGLTLGYSVETEPLGTGAALKQAMRDMPDAPTVIMNGDTWLEFDLKSMLEAHRLSGADITVAVHHVSDAARYGSVVIERDRIVGFHEKGNAGAGWINAGVYLFSPRLFDKLVLPDKFSFESDVLVPYVHELTLDAFQTYGCFIDIGVPQDYRLAEKIFAQTGQPASTD